MATEWLRPKQAVKRFDVSRSTLAEWASREWIGVSRVGKAVWYDAVSIDELIEAGSRPRTVIPIPPIPVPARGSGDWTTNPFWNSGTAAPTTATVSRRREKASRG